MTYQEYVLNRIEEMENELPTVRLRDMEYHWSRQTDREWWTVYAEELSRTFQADDTIALAQLLESAGVREIS